MQRFSQTMPSVALNVTFLYDNSRMDLFLRKEQDILFGRDTEFNHFSGLHITELFDSRFYLITRHDDPLAKAKIITEQDLDGRTFLVGGDSPSEMSAIQQRIIRRGKITILNAHNLDTAFAHVAAVSAVSLAPGFANDHLGEFAWIPFDCPEKCTVSLPATKMTDAKAHEHYWKLPRKRIYRAGSFHYKYLQKNGFSIPVYGN